jgi:hypothetical protein
MCLSFINKGNSIYFHVIFLLKLMRLSEKQEDWTYLFIAGPRIVFLSQDVNEWVNLHAGFSSSFTAVTMKLSPKGNTGTTQGVSNIRKQRFPKMAEVVHPICLTQLRTILITTYQRSRSTHWALLHGARWSCSTRTREKALLFQILGIHCHLHSVVCYDLLQNVSNIVDMLLPSFLP